MINKLSTLLCISAASLTLLAGCGNEEKKTQPIETTTHQEGTTMTRHKMPSGLEYEIIKAGSGDEAKRGQKATVHYTGWLNAGDDTNGTQFDSSHSRNMPFTFDLGLGRVIRGWDEGVAGMKVGEIRRLYIPSALGYGARGSGPIKPNSDLIFDVELLGVK